MYAFLVMLVLFFKKRKKFLGLYPARLERGCGGEENKNNKKR